MSEHERINMALRQGDVRDLTFSDLQLGVSNRKQSSRKQHSVELLVTRLLFQIICQNDYNKTLKKL